MFKQVGAFAIYLGLILLSMLVLNGIMAALASNQLFALNGTFVIFIGLFLLFIFLLNKIMLEPVASVIERRKARIKQDYQSAQVSNDQANEVLSAYETHLHEIRQKSQKTIQEAAQAAQNARTEKLKAAQDEGHKRLVAIKSALTAERGQLLEALVEPELELVGAISDKLLGAQNTITLDKTKVRQVLEGAK
jgi:F-type H+-transporting ATPase subunit b